MRRIKRLIDTASKIPCQGLFQDLGLSPNDKARGRSIKLIIVDIIDTIIANGLIKREVHCIRALNDAQFEGGSNTR